MTRIEFFFDLSSPWTYLAFHNIQKIAGGNLLRVFREAENVAARMQAAEKFLQSGDDIAVPEFG